ncbi:hypothetical protein GCM10022382_24970 [Microbacterium invictum]
MPSPTRPTPASLTTSWPDVPSVDPAGEKARLFALSLRRAIDDRSVRSVAAAASLNEATVRRVLAGAAWPDLHTIAVLESTLGLRLYPS